MAHATHLTIGTADRIRLDARPPGQSRGDEDGENEMRQEVQVSVTYALDPGDTDMVRLAEAKALEVQLAHEAVWNRIGAFSGSAQCSRSGDQAGSGSGRCTVRHDGEEDESDDPDDDPLTGPPQRGGDPFSGGPSGVSGTRTCLRETAGHDKTPPTPAVTPPCAGHTVMGGVAAPNVHETAEPDGDPISGPQKILIRSRAKKAGLTPYALEAMVFKQFRVWKVEKLTKEQATALLDVLERDLKGMNPKQKDERQRLSHGDESGCAVTTGTA